MGFIDIFSRRHLVFIGRQNFLNWTTLKEELSSPLSNHPGELILAAGQFALVPVFSLLKPLLMREILDLKFVVSFSKHYESTTVVIIKYELNPNYFCFYNKWRKDTHNGWITRTTRLVVRMFWLFINFLSNYLEPSSIDYNFWTASNVLQGSRH